MVFEPVCLPALVAAAAPSAITTTTTAPAPTAAIAAASFAAAAAVIAAPTTAPTRTTIFAGTRFIHGQRATLERFAMKHLDGTLGFFGSGHRDEGKPAGFAGHAILHQRDFGDGAGLGKELLEINLQRLKREIADV